jgi:hypothetical protein
MPTNGRHPFVTVRQPLAMSAFVRLLGAKRISRLLVPTSEFDPSLPSALNFAVIYRAALINL